MKYLAKKLAGFVMTMLVVSFLVFAAFAVIPGDPATAMLGTQATPEKLAALREQMGLNEPLLVRFGSWAVNLQVSDVGAQHDRRKDSGHADTYGDVLSDYGGSFDSGRSVLRASRGWKGRSYRPDRQSGDHGDSAVFFGNPDHASVWSCVSSVYTGRVCVLYDECRRVSGIPDLPIGCDCAAESGDGNQTAAHIRAV